ncbi:MAG: GspE/PulE family protein, partial [bacterium]|nr:GspE/PulE family protein [bacterium]
MKLSPDVLKKLLLDSKLISERDFELAKEEARRSGQEITAILLSRGLITEEYLFEIISAYYKVPLAGLAKRTIDKKILEILPEVISRAKRAAVFEKSEKTLRVAMEDPGDLETIEFLRQKTGFNIEPYLASPREINSVFSLYKRDIAEDFRKIIEENIRASLARGRAGEDLRKTAEELPIITIVDSVVSYALSLSASDIHFEVLSDSLLIRFRIDGVLHEIMTMPKEVHIGIVARVKILSNLQIDEHSKPQDGRMKFKLGDNAVDIRVAIMPTFYGEKVELRLLASASKPLSFADLGMSEDIAKLVEENIAKTFGIVLVTGPTGSGKTTTLYAVISKLNRPEVNICTIEDPIEYDMRYINQTQVNPKAGVTFATGLRALLRQDPNIIMVGEIRDNETAEIAVHAALTGHLVLATLHTNDAPTAVPRLIDMDIAPFLVSATVNAVIA